MYSVRKFPYSSPQAGTQAPQQTNQNSTAHLPQQPNYQQQYGGAPTLPPLDLSVLGSTTGAPNAPQIPDYLGQMGQQFNNFQPMDLGANLSNLGNQFAGYQKMYDQIGPQIPVEDVISPQMQSQMLNSAIGANRAQRDTGMRDATQNFGARGFTSESPALQATSNRLGLNEALANTQARTDIPMQTARQNADYRLQAMQANMGQRNQDLQNFIGLENAKTGRISPLLSALVNLV